ncbi:uncharacterized protein MONOS_15738 [Monocercomonoides exilis]|uniref:uncharacterized protein n=1 Tax=Monocercomonoides exilis TaxID=2049356 RepID=UPI00355A2DAB|nr:hypothetical protein MONOS_15738 [Monocercomonoides exilis]|eukprot:MONOS_15738.1-p1 / transcript=MONOS_15738.1 / gene=MONOS_15738 / organism=Monocercomonoides_exilis_PA203 / gene_product=unspecified product / transcript_product=unspecified product / location=Mono_scaffold01336:496-2516(+) / protein_length=476 / sequence_SO=supercontig / SO=protein_coding / is_pseudo=false
MKETANLLCGIVRGTMKEEIEAVCQRKKGEPPFAFGKARTSSQADGKFSVPSAFSSKASSSLGADKSAPKPFTSSLAPMESSGIFCGPAKFPPSFGSAMQGPGPMLPTGLSTAGPFSPGISLAGPFSEEPSFSVSSMAPPGFPAPGFPSSSFGDPLLMPPFNPSDESSPFIGTPARLIEDGEKSQKEGDEKGKKKSESGSDYDNDSDSDEGSDDSEASENESGSDSSSSSSSSEGGKGKEGYKENKKPVKGKMRGPLHFLLLQNERLIRVNSSSTMPVCLGNPFNKGIWRVDLLVEEANPSSRGFAELQVSESNMESAIKKRDPSLMPKKSGSKGFGISMFTSFAPSPGWLSTSSFPSFGSAPAHNSSLGTPAGINSDGQVRHSSLGFDQAPIFVDAWNRDGAQVACEVNTKKKTESFFVDRKKQAIVFTKLPKCVQFQMIFHSARLRVKVLRLDKIKKPTGPKKVSGTKNIEFS